jgi:hypothetical protein
MQNARNGAGNVIMQGQISDPRYAGTHDKISVVQQVVTGYDKAGREVLQQIEIHYWRHIASGMSSGFKFKNPPITRNFYGTF